jgi:HEAT repeat protein
MMAAFRVLRRVLSRAPSSRVVPPTRDPYHVLFDTLVGLLDSSNSSMRTQAARTLSIYRLADRTGLEGLFLKRLGSETDATVRAAFVTYLCEAAKGGSSNALIAVENALNDSSLEVRLSSVAALNQLRPPKALPKLVALVSASEAVLRVAALRSIEAYGDAAKAHVKQIQERQLVEEHVEARKVIERILRRWTK